jgi:hypothetical protein
MRTLLRTPLRELTVVELIAAIMSAFALHNLAFTIVGLLIRQPGAPNEFLVRQVVVAGIVASIGLGVLVSGAMMRARTAKVTAPRPRLGTPTGR